MKSLGPVKSIIRVKDEAEALAVANESEYGLSSAIYSGTAPGRGTWRKICKPAFATQRPHHCTTKRKCRLAAANRQATAALAAAGIAEFTELRWITLQTVPRELPC